MEEKRRKVKSSNYAWKTKEKEQKKLRIKFRLLVNERKDKTKERRVRNKR